MAIFRLLIVTVVIGAATLASTPKADAYSWRHRGWRHYGWRHHGWRHWGWHHRPWRWRHWGWRHYAWHPRRHWGWRNYGWGYGPRYVRWGPRFYAPRVYYYAPVSYGGWCAQNESYSAGQFQQYAAVPHVTAPAVRRSLSQTPGALAPSQTVDRPKKHDNTTFVAFRSVAKESMTGTGWSRLADGQDYPALEAFFEDSAASPWAGGPRIGYALAMGGYGELSAGVVAMRGACQVDPAALRGIKLDEKLRRRVLRLTGQYIDALEKGGARQDWSFMLASLHYLAGDLQAAQSAIDRAVAFGDRSLGARQLRQLITQEVAARHVAQFTDNAPRLALATQGGAAK